MAATHDKDVPQPTDFDDKWTAPEVEGWLKKEYPTLVQKFENVSGRNMAKYSKEDLIRVSGEALGLALYNDIHPNVPLGSHGTPNTTSTKSEPTYFESYVDSTGVDKSVIDRAIRYFPARYLVVHTEEQAQQLINDIGAIPESSTAKLMLDENNIIINGPLCPNLPTKSAFLYGFRGSASGLSSHVIKIPKVEQVDHELKIWQQIQTLEYQGRFVPIELLQFKAGSHMVDIGGTPLTVKKAILMPIYPATLQHPPTIPDNFLYVIGKHVKGSLDMLHSINIAHCDIKPSNLFLSPEGTAIIGDYGAAGKIGSALAETSKAYLAEELLFSPVGEKRCQQIDYCMLATSLLEKHAQWKRTTCTKADLRNRANTITHVNLKDLINRLLDSAGL